MTATDPTETIAAARRRDREAELIEPAATALAAHANLTCFDPNLPDDPTRVIQRDQYRRKARIVLEAAGAFTTAAELRKANTLLRFARRAADQAEADVAQADATAATRAATIAVLTGQAARCKVAAYTAACERDHLVEVIGKLTSLPPTQVAEAYDVEYTGQPAPPGWRQQ